MNGGSGNLAYLGSGTRMYGVEPSVARSRGYWELQWIFSGGARHYLDESIKLPPKSPCLYISHPDSFHGWTDDGSGRSEVFVLHFRTIPEELAALIKPAKSHIVEFSDAEHRHFATRLREALTMSREQDGRLALKLEQVLVEVALLVLGRESPAGNTPQAKNRVENALHWFEENIGGHPSVDDAARAVGVSAAHLRRLFAEAGLESPRTEFARLQMAAAQRCMREGWKLERIAGFLGFSEASAFSRAFAATCGLSPRKWIAAQRQSPSPSGKNR